MFHLYLKYIMIVILASNLWGHVKCQESNLEIPEELIINLYETYKEAFQDDNKDESLRRLFSKNKAYEVHVKRLKNVNGLKKHNLLIKSLNGPDNPLIYINNPVETKIPNAYLSLDEFREVLTSRIQKQKEELSKLNKKKRIIIRLPKDQKLARPTRTNSKLRSYKTMTTNEMLPLISTSRYLVKVIKKTKHKARSLGENVTKTLITNRNTVGDKPVTRESDNTYEYVSNSENDSQETTRKRFKKVIISNEKAQFDSAQSIENHTLGTTNTEKHPLDSSNAVNDSIKDSPQLNLRTKYELDTTKSHITPTVSTTLNIPNVTEYLSTDTSTTTSIPDTSTTSPTHSNLESTAYNQLNPMEVSTNEPADMTKMNLSNVSERINDSNSEILPTYNLLPVPTGEATLRPTQILSIGNLGTTLRFNDNFLRSHKKELNGVTDIIKDNKNTKDIINVTIDNMKEPPTVIGKQTETLTTVEETKISEGTTTSKDTTHIGEATAVENTIERPTVIGEQTEGLTKVKDTTTPEGNTTSKDKTVLEETTTVENTQHPTVIGQQTEGVTTIEESITPEGNTTSENSTTPEESTTVPSKKSSKKFIPYGDNPFLAMNPGVQEFVPTTKSTTQTTKKTKRRKRLGKPRVFLGED